VLSTACSTTEYNPTTYPYQLTGASIPDITQKKLILASNNFGPPGRNYLNKHRQRIDAYVKEYLVNHKVSLIPSFHWDQAWLRSKHDTGAVYNPTTGRINETSTRLAMLQTLKSLAESSDAQWIMFTDIIERDVNFAPTTPHLSSWDGVKRKPKIEGAGHGIPDDFNWGQSATAASIWINIIDMQGNLVFSSAGGLDLTQGIYLKNNARFKRKRKLLNNKAFILEGIHLALHPLIPMENYPGKHERLAEPEPSSGL
jgi:hypothetical protein